MGAFLFLKPTFPLDFLFGPLSVTFLFCVYLPTDNWILPHFPALAWLPFLAVWNVTVKSFSFELLHLWCCSARQLVIFVYFSTLVKCIMPFQSNFVKFSLNIDKNKMFTIVEFFNLFNFENVQNFLRFDILTLGNQLDLQLLWDFLTTDVHSQNSVKRLINT